jgi:hypothetical protein
VPDGTYTGVTLSAVDVDGDAITYSVENGVPFTVNADGQVVTSGAIDFETTPSYTFNVTATSADGTHSTQTITINVADIDDTIVATTADLADASDSGVSQTDNVTNDSTPTINGTTEAGARVVVTLAGVTIGMTVADENGDYSITTVELDDGVKELSITATDAAGNSSTTTQTITIDTSANATIDINPISGDDIITSAERGEDVVISGTVGGDVTNSDVVTITIGGNTYTTSPVDGVFSVTVAGSELAGENAVGNGSISATVSATDSTGNTTTVSTAENYTYDTTNPTIANADNIATTEDHSATGNVLTNDTDADGMDGVLVDSFNIDGTQYSAGTTANLADIGTISISSNGEYVFTPVANFGGEVPAVSYTTNTGATSTLTITNSAVADAPVNVTLSVENVQNSDGSQAFISSDENLLESGNFASVDAVDDVAYTVSFDYTGSETFDVMFGGEVIGTVVGGSGGTTFSFDVSGGAGDGSNSFTFDPAVANIANPYMAPMENMLEYSLDVSASLADTDGSEALSVTLSGLPQGAVLSVGEAGEVAGTWVIPVDGNDVDLQNVSMYIPESADTLSITATATTTESTNGSTTSATASATVVDVTLNEAATATDDSVSGIEDTTLVLSVNDFGTFSDANGDSFTGVQITELPENGILRLLGQDLAPGEDNAVTVGTEISLADIAMGNLVFVPDVNFSGDADFGFRVSDGSSWSEDSYTTTMNIVGVADAPTVSIEIGEPTQTTVTSEGTSLDPQTLTGFDNNVAAASTSTQTYDFGSAYAGQSVTITFTTDIDVPTWLSEGWDSGIDTLNVYVNDMNNPIETLTTTQELDGKISHTITTTLDESGKLQVSMEADSNVITSGGRWWSSTDNTSESVDIGNFKVEFAGVTQSETVTNNTYPIDITTSLTDASETLSGVTLSGIPSEATLYVDGTAVNVTNGSVVLNAEQLANVTMSLPSTVDQNFSLGVSVTAADGSSTATASDTASHIAIADVDTTPTATDEIVNVKIQEVANATNGVTQVDTNVVITLDLSGSMTWDGDLDTAGVQARLEIAKDAINKMIESYDDMGDVNVKLTTFSSSGTSSDWMSAEDAIKMIDNLKASGYTNYEDAVYETYTNFDPAPDADRTIGFFISDGEPTYENNEGRDVSGNVGTDGQSGWLDASYVSAWTAFVEQNLDELNVIGIGTGITNTTYLDMLAQADNALVDINVMLVKDVTELETYLAPNVQVINGNVMDNVDFGTDGEGGISAITIAGSSYTSDTFPQDGLNTEHGKLSFDFDTGDYQYTVVSTSASTDFSETFGITASDADGDTTNFDLTLNVDMTSDLTGTDGNDVIFGGMDEDVIDAGAGDDTIAFGEGDAIDGGEGLDTLVFEGDMNIDLGALDTQISNMETLTLGEGKQEITLGLDDVLDITDADNLLRIDGDSGDTINLDSLGDHGTTEWTLGDFKTDEETGQSYQEVTGTEGDSTVTLEISTNITIEES